MAEFGRLLKPVNRIVVRMVGSFWQNISNDKVMLVLARHPTCPLQPVTSLNIDIQGPISQSFWGRPQNGACPVYHWRVLLLVKQRYLNPLQGPLISSLPMHSCFPPAFHPLNVVIPELVLFSKLCHFSQFLSKLSAGLIALF